MKTLTFPIITSDENKEIISLLQNDYSISFRRMYNNMELMEDKEFLGSLRIKSKKQIEYTQKEVDSFYKKDVANKKQIEDNIKELEEKDKLTLKQFRRLQRLKKSLNNKVVFGGRKELIKLSKGNGDKEKWKESRLLPLVFYGETSRYGNRFFDLKDIVNGNILFKLESTDVKIPITIKTKKHKDELIRLQELVLLKGISVTVKLTKDKIYITYDESILNNTNLDIKAFYKEITHIKDKEERKVLIRNKHIEHENELKLGKLDRYLAIDLNPDGIGYCILEKDNTIVDKGYLEIKKPKEANKRKYETSILIKELFKMIKHYKCHTIIIEELEFKGSTDHGNKVSNRKINNLWNRELIEQIISRRCNEEGILRIEINPCYTSFIGNIMYDEFDPVAASLEIGRRGIHKYSKGGFYPELDLTKFINDKRYDKLKECLTWKDLNSLFVTSKWSYRRKLKQFSFVGYYIGNRKSKVKHLHFN